MAKKKPVNLTLNAEYYDRLREILKVLPQSRSISSLVDEIIMGLVQSFEPLVADLEDPAKFRNAMKIFHSDLVTGASVEFDKAMRTLTQEGEDSKTEAK